MSAKKNGVRAPKSRLLLGRRVVTGAKTVQTRSFKGRLTAFEKQQALFEDAEASVIAMRREQQGTERTVIAGEARVKRAVADLAAAMQLDGASRTSPFAGIGHKSPSSVEKLGIVERVSVAAEIAARALKVPKASKTTLGIAREVLTACRELRASWEAHVIVKQNLHNAIVRRESHAPEWEKCFVMLKRAVLDAEDEGEVGPYEALFGTTKAAKPASAVAEPTPDPAPVPLPPPAVVTPMVV